MRLAKGSRRGQVSKLVPAGFLCPCSRIAPAPFVAKEAGYAQTSSLALTTAFRLRRPASAPPIAAANASGTANPQRFSSANAAAGFRPDMRLATLEMSPNAPSLTDCIHSPFPPLVDLQARAAGFDGAALS